MNNNRPLHQSSLDLWPGETTAGQVLERIRTQSRDETEKGRWFENLVKQVLLNRPEMEVEEVHRWSKWPDREELTGLDGRDLGTDLVARMQDGSWVAIQCKCHAREHRVPKSEIDSFLSHSQREPFALRWVIATSLWSSAAEVLLETPDRPVRRFDFMDWTHEIVAETAAKRPVRQPWALQTTAIADVVEGLRNHERGRLVMACGTGKTFVALRVAEQTVPDGGAILFLAPSIALVSQARREWLRHTNRPLDSRVICSDNTAGGRNEDEDVRISELECPVTTDPAAIAAALATAERTRVVFCTYQSLHQVSLAQRRHGAPTFDLTIADEAHRTTGIDSTGTSDNGLFAEDHFAAFQGVHHADLLASDRRLYMTATPRIYTAASKARRRQEGYTVVDMSDSVAYGPELHRLSFARAVEHDMLSDYRVIVLGVRDSAVTPGLRQQLVALGEEQEVRQGRKRGKFIVKASDMMRVLGTSLAINGVTEGDDLEKPTRLLRTLGFANSIKSSRFYTEALDQPLVKRTTTIRKRKQDGDAAAALPLEVRHLDASHSALERNAALRELANASVERRAQMVCNVRLFTEGVDVPSLDAVVFMEPRDSQVDVVQAVGRVMRKAPGKRFGYIVIPIAIEPGQDLADALEQGAEGYAAVGRVLRALQAHDGRLAEEPLKFMQVYESGGNGNVDGEEWEQATLDIEQASEGIFAKVVNASGLGRPGLLVSQEIEAAVKSAAAVLVEAELERDLAEALGLAVDTDGGARGVCTIAALLLTNACLLHRRLCDVPHMGGLADLNAVGGSQDPRSVLTGAWHAILKRDYAPVFEPALAVMEALPFNRAVMDAVRSLAECANRLADSLSELGYDHAGPLYHRILGSAKSDGAFYTRNVSAVLLAHLALSPNFADWSDPKAVAQLRIMDPACGTGTLLMAALQAVKTRVREATGEAAPDPVALHKILVEKALHGLDINRHGVQLAACNLTLGAPTVDYQRMNLYTVKHGPQPDGTVAAGSLEVLRGEDLFGVVQHLHAEHVNRNEGRGFSQNGLDLVIMNPPFTANDKRGRKYGAEGTKRMQQHELSIRDAVLRRGLQGRESHRCQQHQDVLFALGRCNVEQGIGERSRR